MAGLLTPLRTRLQLTLRRRSSLLHHGEHLSTLLGRSMEFEDLREYVPGDALADIDWKATARSAQPLIRRYTALRAHSVVFVVDTGRGMSAHAASGELKRDIVTAVVGTIGLVAVGSGDRVQLICGDAGVVREHSAGSSQLHLERLVRSVARAIDDAPGASDLLTQLRATAARLRRRALLVIVSDERSFDDALQQQLRRLIAQHDVIWVTTDDLDTSARRDERARSIVDVDTGMPLPPYLLDAPNLQAQLDEEREAQQAERGAALAKLQVHELRVTREAQVAGRVVALLDRMRRSHGRRRA